MKKIIAAIILISLNQTGITQPHHNTLSLKQCVDSAIQNNLLVKQNQLSMEAAAVNFKQSKSDRLPDLFANAGHGFNEGRSIDPFTNSYINQSILYANYSLNSSITLFRGFQQNNIIQQNNLLYEANKLDYQQTKENITLNVILSYLQILNNEEQLQQSIKQAEVTRNQVRRLTILSDSGAVSPGQLYDLKGQLANDELAIVNSKNLLNGSKLTLAQLMNVPYDANLQVEKINTDTIPFSKDSDPKQIFDISLQQLSMIKAAELRKQSAMKGIDAAKGFYYPSLALSGSFNTNYSNAALRDVMLNTEEVQSGDYVTVGGSKVPVMTSRTNYSTQRISYGDQFNNNYNTSLFLSLQIPIFNRFFAKNRVALAKIDLRTAEFAEQTIKTQLSQNIEQAYFNMTAAMERYSTLSRQVKDFAESFRTAEVRFNAGAINQVDYIIAKNNLERSQINLIAAKYDYTFRIKILDYYQGNLKL